MNENLSATFVLYCDWEDIIEDLTDEEVGKLFKAIFAYVNHGVAEQFDGRTGLGVAFKTIRRQIDVNRKKYEQVVEKRRNAAKKRWEKQNPEAQSDANASFAMHNVNDNVDASDASQPSADFSAVELSAEQLNSLVSFSSRSLVDSYIEKARQWQIKFKRRYKDPYKTILGWIQADKGKAKKKSSFYSPAACEKNQSFTVQQLERIVKNYGKGE